MNQPREKDIAALRRFYAAVCKTVNARSAILPHLRATHWYNESPKSPGRHEAAEAFCNSPLFLASANAGSELMAAAPEVLALFKRYRQDASAVYLFGRDSQLLRDKDLWDSGLAAMAACQNLSLHMGDSSVLELTPAQFADLSRDPPPTVSSLRKKGERLTVDKALQRRSSNDGRRRPGQ